MRDHLFIFGIMRSYTLWTWHGEVLDKPTTSRGTNYVDDWMNDHLEDMVRDVGEENFGKVHLYDFLSPIQRKNCTQDALTLRDCQQL